MHPLTALDDGLDLDKEWSKVSVTLSRAEDTSSTQAGVFPLHISSRTRYDFFWMVLSSDCIFRHIQMSFSTTKYPQGIHLSQLTLHLKNG